MAGLGVLLEIHQQSFPKCPQIINKATLFINNPSSSSSSSSSSSPSSSLQPSLFLEQCFLCRQRLLVGKDIYMYRGDRAFCSEDCRCRHILMEEKAAPEASAPRRRGKTEPRREWY